MSWDLSIESTSSVRVNGFRISWNKTKSSFLRCLISVIFVLNLPEKSVKNIFAISDSFFRFFFFFFLLRRWVFVGLLGFYWLFSESEFSAWKMSLICSRDFAGIFLRRGLFDSFTYICSWVGRRINWRLWVQYWIFAILLVVNEYPFYIICWTMTCSVYEWLVGTGYIFLNLSISSSVKGAAE